jgi:hypothetical protein
MGCDHSLKSSSPVDCRWRCLPPASDGQRAALVQEMNLHLVAFIAVARTCCRFISKWFLPKGVEMAGDLGSASARRKSRAPYS